MEHNTVTGRVALVTGAARRIGAEIARHLHWAGFDLVLHHNRSVSEARGLAAELENQRPGSVLLVRVDLCDPTAPETVVAATIGHRGRLDLLVNNASGFRPTALATVTVADWDDLLATNLRAPFFLAQAAARHLRATGGSIVNLADIHGERPLAGHPVYSVAKAGLIMATRALALELAPEVRVNAVAPGAILWPEGGHDPARRERILQRIPLARTGTARDVAAAVLFLATCGPYITGHVLHVDGGLTAI